MRAGREAGCEAAVHAMNIIRKRYIWSIRQIPSDLSIKMYFLPENCECGSKFNIEKSVKKGGFVSIPHN